MRRKSGKERIGLRNPLARSVERERERERENSVR